MDEQTAALVKLAEELTERVDALEKENDRLRQERAALAKQASVQQAAEPVVKTASRETVETTVQALVKAGALEEAQADASRDILMKDPEAPHRILVRILDAQAQSKTASSEQDDVSGGRIVGRGQPDKDPSEACLDRMERILGMT